MKLDKYPPGLLEALNLKVLGRMPSEFSDSILGVVEAFDFYAVDRLATGQTAAAVIGAFDQLVQDPLTSLTPGGPVMVRSMSFAFTEGAAAGTFFHWALGVKIPNSTSPIAYVAGGSFGVIGSGATRVGGVYFGRPLLVPSGSVFIGLFSSDAIGADHSFRLQRIVTSLL